VPAIQLVARCQTNAPVHKPLHLAEGGCTRSRLRIAGRPLRLRAAPPAGRSRVCGNRGTPGRAPRPAPALGCQRLRRLRCHGWSAMTGRARQDCFSSARLSSITLYMAAWDSSTSIHGEADSASAGTTPASTRATSGVHAPQQAPRQVLIASLLRLRLLSSPFTTLGFKRPPKKKIEYGGPP